MLYFIFVCSPTFLPKHSHSRILSKEIFRNSNRGVLASICKMRGQYVKLFRLSFVLLSLPLFLTAVACYNFPVMPPEVLWQPLGDNGVIMLLQEYPNIVASVLCFWLNSNSAPPSPMLQDIRSPTYLYELFEWECSQCISNSVFMSLCMSDQMHWCFLTLTLGSLYQSKVNLANFMSFYITLQPYIKGHLGFTRIITVQFQCLIFSAAISKRLILYKRRTPYGWSIIGRLN